MCLSLNNCCFCISLSTGAKIISIISTFSSVALVMLYGTPAALNASLDPSRRLFYGAVALAALLQVLFGCFLVHGTFRKKPNYTWPWILFAWWQSVVIIVLSIAGAVLVALNVTKPHPEASTVIFVYFIYGIILYYLTSVVNRRRHEMSNEEYTYLSKSLVRRTNYYI